jgi:hypothetical protein
VNIFTERRNFFHPAGSNAVVLLSAPIIAITYHPATRQPEGERDMRLRLVLVPLLGLLIALTFALPLTADDNNKKNKTDPALNPLDSDKLPAADYTGTLLTLPSSDNTFTVQIDFKYLVPKNPGALSAKESKLQAEINSYQQKILTTQANLAGATTAKNITKYQNQLNTETAHLQTLLAQSQIKPSDLKEVTDTKVYEMKLKTEADIRYMNLPTVFDDDGKVKKYTDAELKELKGKKTSLPGYEGKLEDLKVNQTIRVTLVYVAPKPKPKDSSTTTDKTDAKTDDTKKADPKPDDAKKDDTKKDDADKTPPEKKMQVKMIVIVQDPPDDSTDPKKKKKNN